jgi:AcrR family transcriptional regulator
LQQIGVATLMSTSNSSRGRRGLPRGPHGLTPSEVARNQRERLIAAMTEAVAERGYAATPVSEVIERAGVSRKTFYVHFKDRRDCLMAAYDVAAEGTLSRLEAARRSREAPRKKLSATVTALCEAAAENPGAWRLQVSEIAAAGQEALLAREQLILTLSGQLRDGLSPSSSAPPIPLLGLISSALLQVIEQRALTGQLEHSADLASELARWARSYHPAPAVIASADGHSDQTAQATFGWSAPIGGRAPGTLSLTSRRPSDAGRSVSVSFTAHSQRERILDSVANLCASKGYVALTVDEIVAVAGVSLNTFYEHFKDKDDAFLVANELGHLRGTAILQQALDGASSWDAAVREGLAALLGFFFSEPAFARMAAIDAPIASPQIAARVRAHIATYAELLFDGAPRSRRPPPVAREAIAAALHAAVFTYAVRGAIRYPARAHSYATYLVLAPFLGPQKAFAEHSPSRRQAARRRS